MNDQTLDDTETIRRILGGEHDLYRRLVARYRRDLHLRANRILPCQADRDDAVQETFVRAYFRLKDFRLDADFRAWLYGILRNVAGDAYRRAARNRETPLAEETLDLLENMSDRHALPAANPGLVDFLGACLKQLGDKARRMITMRYAEGMSGKRVGQMLAMTEFAVNVAVMRARASLRECIEMRMRTAI